MNDLTADEKSFILDALNHYWHAASDKLKNPEPLGDIEKRQYEAQKIKAKELMTKLDNS
jgi:hypothetical protein